jgi:hypothetical protein
MGIDILRFQASKYTRVADEEDGVTYQRNHGWWSLTYIGRFLLILLVTVLAICGWIYSVSRPRACGKETTRHEWQSLSTPQKHEYLTAVQCLKTRPSKLGMNHTLYDDFPFVHSHFGEYGRMCQILVAVETLMLSDAVHDAAPFLAWHRYFVHIYETTLKSECGYMGSMP